MSDEPESQEDTLRKIQCMTEIAFESREFVDRVAYNDFDHRQMLRAVHFTLWGEDIGEA